MKFITYLNNDGSGYWCAYKPKQVKTEKLELHTFDDSFGELRVHFDTNTWNIKEDGLIYTDNLWLKQLKIALKSAGFDVSDIDYSEQGMQGVDFVSLDVGKNFIKSYLSKL